MATKTIRIGSLVGIHNYDDADFAESMEVEDPIVCTGTPTDPNHLAKLSDSTDEAMLWAIVLG